jgi:hypothetical protein
MINDRHSTIATSRWDAGFAARSPMFEPLRSWAEHLRTPGWPTLDALQSLISEEPALRARDGEPLALVKQEKGGTLSYEARIWLQGEVEVRAASWHDVLNVLAWRVFPRTKAAINAAHFAALPKGEGGRRGTRRDALTLFDESGALVASSDPALLDMLRGFRWRELFWEERERARQSMRFVLFGHALYEKALAPYVGLTAHALLVQVEPEFLHRPLHEQIAMLDEHGAARIADPATLRGPVDLAPLPVLGVPGWWADNEHEAFYANERYFRRGRRGATP